MWEAGFDPWVGKIPWRRKWQPTLGLLPGKSHGQRSLVVYSPWGHKESDTTERLHFHFSLSLSLFFFFFLITGLCLIPSISEHTHCHPSCQFPFQRPFLSDEKKTFGQGLFNAAVMLELLQNVSAKYQKTAFD